MAFLLVTSAFAFSPAAHTILRQPTIAPISYQPLITAPVHAARPVPVLMTTLDPSDNSGDRFEGALLMLVVALLWGSNFPAVKATIEAGLPSSAAASMRFFVAAVALLPLLSQGPRPMPRGLVIAARVRHGSLSVISARRSHCTIYPPVPSPSSPLFKSSLFLYYRRRQEVAPSASGLCSQPACV